jgi:hypothetical protein
VVLTTQPAAQSAAAGVETVSLTTKSNKVVMIAKCKRQHLQLNSKWHCLRVELLSHALSRFSVLREQRATETPRASSSKVWVLNNPSCRCAAMIGSSVSIKRATLPPITLPCWTHLNHLEIAT